MTPSRMRSRISETGVGSLLKTSSPSLPFDYDVDFGILQLGMIIEEFEIL